MKEDDPRRDSALSAMQASGGKSLPLPARNALALLGVLASVTLIGGVLVAVGGSSGLLAGETSGPSSLLSIAGINIGNLAEVAEGEEAPGFPVGDDVQWLNTLGSKAPDALRGMPLDMKQLHSDGKQVLLHFWDYTDVDSLKSVPVVRQLNSHYASYGLQIISVHKSGYPFAAMMINLADAVERLGIKHPVVNDKDGDITNAYGSKDTLNFFLIDEHNIVRAVHGGKGSEEKIQSDVCKALQSKYGRIQCEESDAESNFKAKSHGSLWIHPKHYPHPPAFPPRAACRPSTSEVLVGHEEGKGSLTARQEYSTSSGPVQYTDLSGLEINDGTFALSGDWETHEQGMTVVANPSSGLANTHLRLRYHGKEVLALMGVEGREHAEKMCADGAHGGAEEHTACTSECENEGGAEGVYGWCRTDGGMWGGCTPCEAVEAAKVYVEMNGEPLPTEVRGKDVREDALGRTFVTVLEPRVYFLVQEEQAWPRGLELIAAAPGVTIHSFSFAGQCTPDWDHMS